MLGLNRKSLKIALPSSSFLPSLGGAEIGLHNICLKLIEKGHTPFVITSYSHTKKNEILNFSFPYKIISLPPKISSIFEKNFKTGFFFFDLFYSYLQKKYNFDFWHATFGYPIGLSVIHFCVKKKIPHLVRCVGEDIQINQEISYGYRINKKIDSLIKNTFTKSDCMIAVSGSIKNDYLKLGIKRNNIHLIPNGVDLKRINKFRKKKRIYNGNKIVLLSLGRYHKKKNFEILISVYEKLIKDKYKFEAIIAGSNMESLKNKVKRKKIHNVVKVLNIEKKIKSVNQIPNNEVFELYNNADYFVMTSKIESFGIVTIEAMAFGLPVLAANSPGNIDVLENGKFGIIYDNSESDLLRKLKTILQKENRERLSKKSLDRAKIYDWSVIVDKYINLYYQLIKKRTLDCKK